MKIDLRFLLFILLLNSCSKNTKLIYNGLPTIKASQVNIDYKVADDWHYGWWSIAPEVANDTLQVTCYNAKEKFLFKTNIDSIGFEIKPNQTKKFYVLLHDSLYAHTIIQGVPFRRNKITFDSFKNSKIKFNYPNQANEYLSNLKQKYPINFGSNISSEKDTVLSILNWTNSRWEHSGNNSPKKNDGISILEEAESGGRFPCFAYAIVLRDQLTSLGYKARTVYLKTQDAKTRKGSPGHVATEVYLDDLKKWIFIDGQFNVMPTLNGVPLNAVEFQNAINNNYEQFKLESLGNKVVSKRYYVNFVYDYLFYLDTALDNRYDKKERVTIDDKRSLMLVPKGSKNLDFINFWNMKVDYCLYTNSLSDFYEPPN